MRAALEALFPPEQVSRYRFDDVLYGSFTAFDTFAPSLRASVLLPTDDVAGAPSSLVAGHLSLQSMQRLLHPGDVFTVLREPRARLLSHQLFWAVQPGNYAAFGEYQVQRLSLDGLRPFLERSEGVHQTDNLICRMLAGDSIVIPRDRAMTSAERNLAAQAAIDSLETLGLATYVESPTMWDDVSAFVGAPVQPVSVNVTSSADRRAPFTGPQFSIATLELLEERTAADAQVFRHLVSSRTGCSAEEATRLADNHFVGQVERYARVASRAEQASDPAPVAAAEPCAGVAVASRSWWQRGRG